jgi:hypothetical protein
VGHDSYASAAPPRPAPAPATPARPRVSDPAPARPVLWAAAVTTCAARLDTLLPRTLASLAAGGFGRPRLFADGVTHQRAADLERVTGCPVTARSPAVRTAGSWVLALYELYLRDPQAHRYAVFQDDVEVMRNLRPYLERVPFPPQSYLNLITQLDSENAVRGKPVGWHEGAALATSPPQLFHGRPSQKGCGACALVFDRGGVVELLSSRHLAARPQHQHRGWQAIDGGVVESLNRAGWRELVHQPSLCSHVGGRSTMGHRPFPRPLTYREGDALDLL